MRKTFIITLSLILIVGPLWGEKLLSNITVKPEEDIVKRLNESVEKYSVKNMTVKRYGISLLLVGDIIQVETEPLDKNVKIIKYKIKGDSVEFFKKNTKNPSQGYIYKFIAANSGISKIIIEKIKFGKGKDIVEKKEYKIKVFDLKDVEKVLLADIVKNNEKYYEKFIILSGYNRGWGKPEKAKEVKGTLVMRSDWILEDDSGAVYITGFRVQKEILRVNILAEVIRLSQDKWAVRGDRILKIKTHKDL